MLILASNSPRRRQLLSLGGWPFSVFPAHVDENVLPGELPAIYVRRLAETKAKAVQARLPMPNEAVGEYSRGEYSRLVVAADTTVVDAGMILGKPLDAQDAEQMLRRLRGRVHQVYTGLAVLAADGRLLSDVCVSDVFMRPYSDAEMQAYIESGDPLDKAGAYAIQHNGFKPVKKLVAPASCYANVMGLPICHLARLLAAFGVNPAGQVHQACQQVSEQPCDIYTQVLGTAV